MPTQLTISLTPEECAAVRQVIEPAYYNQVQYIGDMLLKELTAETQIHD